MRSGCFCELMHSLPASIRSTFNGCHSRIYGEIECWIRHDLHNVSCTDMQWNVLVSTRFGGHWIEKVSTISKSIILKERVVQQLPSRRSFRRMVLQSRQDEVAYFFQVTFSEERALVVIIIRFAKPLRQVRCLKVGRLLSVALLHIALDEHSWKTHQCLQMRR